MSSRRLVRHNGAPCPFTTVVTLVTVHFMILSTIVSLTTMVAVKAESSLTLATTDAASSLRQGHFHTERRLQTITTNASTKLYLMDAVTDQIVQDLTMTAVTWINSKDAIVPRYNVQAILSNSTQKIMSLMAWQYNGALRTEYVAPWALCGNSGADFVPCTKLVSSTQSTTTSSANDVSSLHVASISATPHQKSANGADVPIPNAAATATIVMAPIDVHPFTVTIVNADSNVDIVTLPLAPSTAPDHSPYALKRSVLPPRFNVRYNLHPYFTQNGIYKVSSMLLSWNHSSLSSGTPFAKDALTFHSKMEYGAPYALFGNAGSDYWTGPTVNNVTVVSAPGLIQLSATLFGSNGQGAQRPILTHSMTIVLQNDRPTAPVPAPTPMAPNTTKTSKLELQQLTLSTNTVDVSLDDDAIVSMQVQLAEYADSSSTSLVGFVQATLQDRGLNATTLPLIVPLGEKTTVTSGDVQVHSYNAIDLHLSPYQALGIYDLVVLIWDDNRSEYTWNSTALQSLNLPHTLQVTSSSDNAVATDVVAPDLMSLVRLPSQSNSSLQTHSFIISIHDAGSGFRMGTLEAVHRESLDVVSVDFAMDEASSSFWNSAVTNDPADVSTTDTITLKVTLSFASTVPRGVYALRIYLYDAVLNQNILQASDLEARQWPSSIALV